MMNLMIKNLHATYKVLLAAFFVLGFATASLAEDKVRTENVSDHNLALKGYDAVAYFDQGAPTAGKARFNYVHNGTEYRFGTATNRDKFTKNPGKYEPQYGGFCAFGASVGLKLEVDPESFEIVDGKLYLNNAPQIHTMWLEDPKGRIKAANKNWKKIRNVSAKKLKPLQYEG